VPEIPSNVPLRQENTTAKMCVFREENITAKMYVFLSLRYRCRNRFIFKHSGFWLPDYGENVIRVLRGTPSGEVEIMGSRRHLPLSV
jgi:hypothetical protein